LSCFSMRAEHDAHVIPSSSREIWLTPLVYTPYGYMTTLSMTFRRRVSEETRSWVSVARR
jgi:uncharacterized membrane protein